MNGYRARRMFANALIANLLTGRNPKQARRLDMKSRSYKLITAHDHPRHYSDGRIKEHIFLAEKALGHELTSGQPVHHADGRTRHNVNNNLVICQDVAYHQLLHVRIRALRESGNVHNRWCSICKTWDNPENIIEIGHNTGAHHECKKMKDSEYYFSKREAFKIKNARNYLLRKQRQAANERGDKATLALYYEQFRKGGMQASCGQAPAQRAAE